MEIERTPIPMNTRNQEHILAIGDFYLFLKEHGDLVAFEVELREPFAIGKKKYMFCPDAFFIWNGKVCTLEVQLTPMSKDRWKEKHTVRNLFFDGNHHHKASFQKYARIDKTLKPSMVVWCGQQHETIQHGATDKLLIVKEPLELLKLIPRKE